MCTRADKLDKKSQECVCVHLIVYCLLLSCEDDIVRARARDSLQLLSRIC